MGFIIEADKVNDQEWSVRVINTSPTARVINTRSMQCKGAFPNVFPQPAQSELDQLPSADPGYNLCTTNNPQDIFDVYANIARKDVRGNDVVVFGRYLFATLIGEQAWQAILAEAQTGPIDLALLWDDDDWELHRLPWEMMRNSTGTLAANRRVSLTRLVPGSNPAMTTISLRPKVLFVVGSDMNDVKVKPGTEYIGMLRRLEDQNLRLNSRILHRATSQQVEDEIESFQPSVVHFICHGGFDNKGKAYLEMAPDKPTDPAKQVYAASLLSILGTRGDLPPVVVLNACYTGVPPVTRKAPPLAFELVKGGVPMVVGMGGRVADIACRLFTRRFYEALLKGESVADATAHGRRAGIMHIGAQVDSLVDWAMPTLYLSKNVSPRIAVDPAWVAQAQQVELYAGKYRSINDPPFFCDRYEFIESYHKLLHPLGRTGAQPATPFSVIAVEVDAWEPTVKKPQYGKTRLLEELAAQAVRDGHVPCLLTYRESDAPPIKAMQLGKEIVRAIRTARITLGLNPRPGYEFLKLERRTDPTISLHPEVQDELDWGSSEGKVVRAALKLDLLALQDEARARVNCPGLKVIVLIDEAHRFDEAAREFVHNMIDSAGLGSDANPVPVVFTFSAVNVRPEYNAAVQVLQEFLDRRPLYVNRLSLGAFRPPKDEWILFQQFLLYQDPPLIIRQDKEDQSRDVYEALYDETKGVPSQLTGVEVKAAIRMAKKTGVLVEADDNEMLKRQE